jgi:hypothetical protein
MKAKKSGKRLILNKKTVSNLDKVQMNDVYGGLKDLSKDLCTTTMGGTETEQTQCDTLCPTSCPITSPVTCQCSITCYFC